QPVLRVAKEHAGQGVQYTYEANPGRVWEEDEFWIDLSWAIDASGKLGVRKHFESPYRPGQKITVDEYYRYIFERVPGLPEAAKSKGLDPLAYMRKFGAFEVQKTTYERHERRLSGPEAEGTEIDPDTRVVLKGGKAVGVERDGVVVEGFPTPSRKQEL